MKTILLKNGLVVDPSQGINAKLDVLIENGIVVDLAPAISVEAEEVYDLAGKIIAPGFIDMHVHLREPGYEEKETIKTGSKAAVVGGFTTIACMANTDPVADDVAIIKHIKEVSARNGIVNVAPIGACTKGLDGKKITQMGEMQRFGAVAFSDDGAPVTSAKVMRKVLEYAGMFGAVVISHSEDLDLAGDGSMNQGRVSTRLGLPGIPRAAESAMIARDIELAGSFGALHVAHISTRESVDLIRFAKQRGIKVTCEVTPHHLILTEEAVEGYDTNAKMSPPLRTTEDVEALRAALNDGTIDIIATDHAPHTEDNKAVEFNLASNGIVGLETAVPLIYSHLVKSGQITIDKMVQLMSCAPSRVFDLKKGTLAKGSVADVTIIDPECCQKVDKTKFLSKGRNTPFNGWELFGWPYMTIVNGLVKYYKKEGLKV